MIDVLLVDDEASFLRDLAEGLRISHPGVQVFTAQSGEKAIQFMKTALFDVVVTDLNMPGTNGFDLLRKIRELYPHVPVIVMSAYTRSYVEERLKGIRLASYIEKPLDLDEFVNAVLAAS